MNDFFSIVFQCADYILSLYSFIKTNTFGLTDLLHCKLKREKELKICIRIDVIIVKLFLLLLFI